MCVVVKVDMTYKGKAHIFGNDINTDEIIPARYLNMIKPEKLAPHCMEGLKPDFVKKIEPGDIIVAGKNFGCGSSREHAAIAIKASGISCVVAKSFARIFYRNAINIGLPIVVCEKADDIKKGNKLSVSTKRGIVKNITRRQSYTCEKYAPFIQSIIKAEGLLNYVKRR